MNVLWAANIQQLPGKSLKFEFANREEIQFLAIAPQKMLASAINAFKNTKVTVSFLFGL